MKFFEISDRVNQNRTLTLQQKVILNQILSYQLNGNTFFASNEYLMEYWGVCLATIKNTLQFLNEQKIIQRSRQRKNINGVWLNKRTITVNLDELVLFLGGNKIIIEPIEEKFGDEVTVPIEPEVQEEKVSTTIMTKEPIDFAKNIERQFPQEENEHTRNMAEAEKAKQTPKVEEYQKPLVKPNNTYKNSEMIDVVQVCHEIGLDAKAASFIAHDLNTTKVIMGDFVMNLMKLKKEQQYNDYTGPKIDISHINNLRFMLI